PVARRPSSCPQRKPVCRHASSAAGVRPAGLPGSVQPPGTRIPETRCGGSWMGSPDSSGPASCGPLPFVVIRLPTQCGGAGVDRAFAELFLDAEELVVLRGAVGARRCADLDLTGAGGDGEVGDRRVLR